MKDEKPKCPRCEGLGFYQGQICICVAKKDDPPYFMGDTNVDWFFDLLKQGWKK
jgi:hypothetical protein